MKPDEDRANDALATTSNAAPDAQNRAEEKPADTSAPPAPGAFVSLATPEPDPPKVIAPPSRWELILLVGTLALGILFDVIFGIPAHQPLALLWLGLAALLLLTPGAFRRRNVVCYIALGSAALLSLSTLYFASFDLAALLLGFAVPALLMAAAVWARFDVEASEKHVFALEYLLGWFMRPFHRIGRFFGVLRRAFPGKANPVALRVLIGIAISVPLLCIVCMLLFSADAYFSQAFADILATIRIERIVVHALRIGIPMMLLFSFLSSYEREPFLVGLEPPRAHWDPVIIGTLLSAMLAVYAIFCGFQFVYLFGGRAGFENSGTTYADYARRGFSEMNMVCAINLLLYWAALRFSRGSRWIRIALAGLLVATGVMLASAALRLWLYVDAYGMTTTRLQAAWMIALEAMVVVVCAVRLVRPRLPHVRIAASVAMAWLVVFVLASPDAVVARYNGARIVRGIEAGEKIDADLLYYTTELSNDAVPTLLALRERIPADEEEAHNTLDSGLLSKTWSLQKRVEENAWLTVSDARALRLLEAAGYDGSDFQPVDRMVGE